MQASSRLSKADPVGEQAEAGADTPTLSVAGLRVSIAGREILRDVSFEVAPGQLAGLIGGNGAGKTTLMKVILGLQGASAGSVRLDGERRARRSAIGYVPQRTELDRDLPLRCRDLVDLGIDAHRLGFAWPSRRRRALVEETLQAVGARDFAEERVGALSGGEQQRVLIAHALVCRPRLLLLDEPLASLDIPSVEAVVAVLAQVAAEQAIAVLVSSHELNPLLPVMDKVVYLAGGRAASGSTEEVIRADVLSRLYGYHVDVLRVHGRVIVVAGAGSANDLSGHEGVFPGSGLRR